MTEAVVKSNRKLKEDFRVFMGEQCLAEDALQQQVSELKAEVQACEEHEGGMLADAEHYQEAGCQN